MGHVSKVDFHKKVYNLVPTKYSNKKDPNIFTIIIGNNGSGKSRFLSHIIKESFQSSFQDKVSNLFSGNNSQSFSKIIAITSSPFDKFPDRKLFNRFLKLNSSNENPYYKYLGLREDRTYITRREGQFFKILDSLFDVRKKNTLELEKLAKTFSLLGYEPKMLISYRFDKNKLVELLLDSNSADEFINNTHTSSWRINGVKFRKFNLLFEERPEVFDEIKGALEILFTNEAFGRTTFQVDISSGSLLDGSFKIFDEIQILRKYDIVKFHDLRLWKKNTNHEISFIETSSGERALFLNILGIASEIDNNTLVCIDEPEISLHPEWQEKYMKLLMSTFNQYMGCHFIIATHSPSIISDVKESDSFILNMDENKLLCAQDYINHSSDFQLAKLFKVPGFRNEYLNRESVNVLTLLSKECNRLSPEIKSRAEELIQLISKLDAKDPVRELILIIQETLKKLEK